jgi:hypothetical protein
MDTSEIIQSQCLAVLGMLEQVIVKGPEASWNAPGDKGKFENHSKDSNLRVGMQPTV